MKWLVEFFLASFREKSSRIRLMAYRFKRKESVSKAVRRLGCERVKHALACLNQADRAEAIHGARKNIKKARAVARLVREQIAKKEFRRLADALRDAASQLAAPRDAYIRTQTLRKLMRDFRGRLPPAAMRHTSDTLRADFRQQIKCFLDAGGPRAVEQALHRAAKTLRHLEVDQRGWQAIGPGVKTAYRKGRRACRTARATPAPANFHAWRKRAKDLWYQVRLLQPAWPGQMEAMARELEALGDWLGDDHDLAVLRQYLDDKLSSGGNLRGAAALDAVMTRRQRELRRAALALGARFYAEKPSAFGARLAGYWKAWRHEKPAKHVRAAPRIGR